MSNIDKEKIIDQLHQNNFVIKQLIDIIPVEKMTAYMSIIISENIQIIKELENN